MTTTLTEGERSIVDAVAADRLLSHTGALAQWERISGTDDERRAFDYIEQVLRDLGLEPRRYLGRSYSSTPETGELRVDDVAYEPITHAMAASTPPEGLRAPLLHVGNGRADDYVAHDARGSIVFVDGMAMPAKVAAAERAGALAAVFANRDEHVHQMIVSGVWGSPTPETRPLLPRLPVVSLGAAQGDRLRAVLEHGGRPEAHLSTRVRTAWTELPTLVAQLEGISEPEKFVLFSGHVDSWYFGAMDNGTANATMLETLRVLVPHRQRLSRSLRLAFWSGHSQGRYAGSAWYADHFWEDLHDHCVLHLNVDSVGGRGATVLTEAHAMAETRRTAAEAIAALTEVEFTGTRFGRAGDQSFQGHGAPSLFMSLSEQPAAAGDASSGFAELVGGAGAKSGGLGWWWHTTEDTPDKIDPELLVRDARIYALTAYRFLSRAVLPLDIRTAAVELASDLRSWKETAGTRFDLAEVVNRAERLSRLATDLQATLPAGDRDTELAPARAAELNEALQEVVRLLVRLSYTQTDPYHHDPALSQPPVPLLGPLDDLVRSEPGSDAEGELLTLLVRRRNRVAYELREATRAVGRALEV